MDFKEEKLPIYNDTLVFNDLMNRGFYNVLNYSDLSDDYILDNINFIIKIIRNGQYILSSNSPKNIKNNYLFYIASFDAGNINPLFFYRGNIKDLDDYFKKNPSLMENIIDIYNNKFKLKKIIDFNSYISVLYFGLLNKKIVDGLIDIRNCTCLDKIIPYLNGESIKKMYGQNVFDFTSRYGYHIILNGKYKYISKLSSLQLNKFYSVFELRNGHVQNLTNLYNALVEYNFVYKASDDILNGQSFSLIKKDNIDYVYALVFEISKYLSKDDKEKIISEYGSDIYKLFDKYMNLYGSNNYKEFNKYSSIIRNICSLGYNRKREEFILSKNNLENGFPFDIELSPKMRRIINKKKLMQKTCLDIAYDMKKLNKLKEYLVNKGYINNDFDTNILFALLTDGVKSVKLIEFDIDINYLMGKILNYVSLSIDNALIDDSVPFEEYKNLPLNDDCFVVKSDIKEIVNKIDLENFFENVINNEEKYDLFKKYIDYYENNVAVDYFMGKMDREIFYIIQCEHYWQPIYLMLGEWKKAFMTLQTCLKYGMSHDAHQTQERFNLRNPAFAPWQPNGSGNGRIIDMMLNALYFENKDEVTILGGVPFEYLISNRITTVKNLYTLTGCVNLVVKAIDDKHCQLELFSEQVLPKKIRIPEYLNPEVRDRNVESISGGVFKLVDNKRKITFLLTKSYE